jgi:excisionase family DNA binding protein
VNIVRPSTPTTAPLALRQAQAAAALGVSVATLSDLTRRGIVPHVRLGRRTVLYPVQALADWLRERQVGAVESHATGGNHAQREL